MRSIVIALPLVLLLPMGAAKAQVGGSYQGSCTGISQDGSMLSARCRAASGQFFESTIDVERCRGQGVSNTNGRLTCGGVQGSARPAGGGRFGDEGGPRRYQRYDGEGGPPRGYDAPPPRYRPPEDQNYGYAPPPRRPRYDPDQED